MTTFTDLYRENFNGDGGTGSFGDLFLYTDQGNNAAWLMNQNVRQGTGADLQFTGPSWHMKAAAEFDSQGPLFSDLLWQNDSGALALWQMNGTAAQNKTNLPSVDPSWHVVAANDFDGNRSADILFQNNNGALAIWEFQSNPMGTTFPPVIKPGGQLPVDQPVDPSWHVAATGDTDGDNRSGILFQNNNGALAIWESANMVTGGPGQVVHFTTQADLGNVGTTWHVKGMGDFNGDGRADIIFQHDSGALAIWELGGPSGTSIIGQFNLPSVGPTWHVVGVRDMNADAKADLVFQNDNGAVAVWENFSPTGAQTATFLTQLDVIPNPNPSGHLDWHVV
jgi:serralysin